jgi:hypothetical protein
MMPGTAPPPPPIMSNGPDSRDGAVPLLGRGQNESDEPLLLKIFV